MKYLELFLKFLKYLEQSCYHKGRTNNSKTNRDVVTSHQFPKLKLTTASYIQTEGNINTNLVNIYFTYSPYIIKSFEVEMRHSIVTFNRLRIKTNPC